MHAPGKFNRFYRRRLRRITARSLRRIRFAIVLAEHVPAKILGTSDINNTHLYIEPWGWAATEKWSPKYVMHAFMRPQVEREFSTLAVTHIIIEFRINSIFGNSIFDISNHAHRHCIGRPTFVYWLHNKSVERGHIFNAIHCGGSGLLDSRHSVHSPIIAVVVSLPHLGCTRGWIGRDRKNRKYTVCSVLNTQLPYKRYLHLIRLPGMQVYSSSNCTMSTHVNASGFQSAPVLQGEFN